MNRPPIRVEMTATVDVPAEERDQAVIDAESVLRGLSAGRTNSGDLSIKTLPDGTLRITVTAQLGEYRPLWEPEETTGPAPEPIPSHQLFGPGEAS